MPSEKHKLRRAYDSISGRVLSNSLSDGLVSLQNIAAGTPLR